MGARFNQLSIDLSKLLVDEVAAANLSGKEYTASQRTLAVNRAEGNIIAKMVSELNLTDIISQLREMMRPYSTAIVIAGSPFNSPLGSVRVVKVWLGGSYFIPVEPEEWDAIRLGVNPEETANIYGTLPVFRWTELASETGVKQVHFTPTTSGIFSVRYIPDHVDLTPASVEDLLLPGRFDSQILKEAYNFITSILPNKQ